MSLKAGYFDKLLKVGGIILSGLSLSSKYSSSDIKESFLTKVKTKSLLALALSGFFVGLYREGPFNMPTNKAF